MGLVLVCLTVPRKFPIASLRIANNGKICFWECLAEYSEVFVLVKQKTSIEERGIRGGRTESLN